jgi:hypothetical protein
VPLVSSLNCVDDTNQSAGAGTMAITAAKYHDNTQASKSTRNKHALATATAHAAAPVSVNLFRATLPTCVSSQCQHNSGPCSPDTIGTGTTKASHSAAADSSTAEAQSCKHATQAARAARLQPEARLVHRVGQHREDLLHQAQVVRAEEGPHELALLREAVQHVR